MQDNKKYQQLVDRGWQQMSTLLDAEMPQARKRRRITMWWFAAAGIMLSVAALGYFSWQSVQRESQPELPHSDRNLETATLTPATNDVTSLPKGESATSSQSDKHTSSASQSSTNHPIVQDTKTQIVQNSENIVKNESASSNVSTPTLKLNQTHTETVEAENLVEKTSDKVTAVSSSLNAVQTNTESPISKQSHSEVAENTSSDMPGKSTTSGSNSADLVQVRENYSITRLSASTPAEFGQASRSMMIISASAPKRERDFGLEGLIATHVNSDGNSFYGVEAGLNAIVWSHRRVRANAGLSYGYYNVDGLGLFSSATADTENFGNIGSGGNPDSNYTSFPLYAVKDIVDGALEYSEVRQLTEKFHYVHVPVRVEYRITPRFSLMAGMKVSALFAAPARYRLNDVRFAASQADPASVSNSFLYNYDILRKFDIAPLAGLSYRFGERWSFDAIYSHGLVHYINNSNTASAVDRSDFHRSASLGMRYRIL